MDPFEKLYQDHAPVVYRFLLSLCGDADTAEELTAETFYQAYLHIDRFRGECAPQTWLCQIARNAWYKESKRNRRFAGPPPTEAAAGDDLLERLMDKEQALALHRRLHDLPEPYREVFMLRVLGELKFQEIAVICNRSEVWAKVTFYRAKDKLIQALEERP